MKLSDDQILNQIRNKETTETTMRYLYVDAGWYRACCNYLTRQGAELQDAEEAVQDAFVSLHTNIIEQKYNATGSLRAYFFRIARNIFYKKSRSKRHPVELLEKDGGVSDMATFFFDESEMIAWRGYWNSVAPKIDAKCLEILKDSMYMNNLDLAEVHGLKNKEQGNKKKFRCREKLMKQIRENPHWILTEFLKRRKL